MLLHIYTAVFNLYLNKYEVFYIIKLLLVNLNQRISQMNALSVTLPWISPRLRPSGADPFYFREINVNLNETFASFLII